MTNSDNTCRSRRPHLSPEQCAGPTSRSLSAWWRKLSPGDSCPSSAPQNSSSPPCTHCCSASPPWEKNCVDTHFYIKPSPGPEHKSWFVVRRGWTKRTRKRGQVSFPGNNILWMFGRISFSLKWLYVEFQTEEKGKVERKTKSQNILPGNFLSANVKYLLTYVNMLDNAVTQR